MKLYLIVAATTLLFSSCLKESIPDAILSAELKKTGGGTAKLSYELNGDPISVVVPNAGKQNPNRYELGISKMTGFYSIFGLSYNDNVETNLIFLTDSLNVGTYTYPGNNSDLFLINYKGENEFIKAPSDFLTVVVTSNNKGYISGSFTGQLTPLIQYNQNNPIYGVPSSIKITKGLFTNVPVFY